MRIRQSFLWVLISTQWFCYFLMNCSRHMVWDMARFVINWDWSGKTHCTRTAVSTLHVAFLLNHCLLFLLMFVQGRIQESRFPPDSGSISSLTSMSGSTSSPYLKEWQHQPLFNSKSGKTSPSPQRVAWSAPSLHGVQRVLASAPSPQRVVSSAPHLKERHHRSITSKKGCISLLTRKSVGISLLIF